jgi:bifunctional DNA-binding transcriptional regulator/antitoxin component of YhaV-PrlF toxin-antitoxin module
VLGTSPTVQAVVDRAACHLCTSPARRCVRGCRSRRSDPWLPHHARYRAHARGAILHSGGYCGSARPSRIGASQPSPSLPLRHSSIICAADQRFVPVDPPHDRPIRRDSTRAAAALAISGTGQARSMSSGKKDGSQRGRPMPSISEGAPSAVRTLRSMRWRWKTEASGSARQSRVGSRRSSYGRRRPACPSANHDPYGNRVLLACHLGEDGLGDIVVPTPVRGALGVRELIHVVAAERCRESRALSIHICRAAHEMALALIERDLRDLFGRGQRRGTASARGGA